MSEKRFNIKSTATELELYDNGVKIGEFPHFEWVARPVDYVINVLNEQQATISQLKEENENLRKELGDCEKFRYAVFKRIGELNVERK